MDDEIEARRIIPFFMRYYNRPLRTIYSYYHKFYMSIIEGYDKPVQVEMLYKENGNIHNRHMTKYEDELREYNLTPEIVISDVLRNMINEISHKISCEEGQKYRKKKDNTHKKYKRKMKRKNIKQNR